MESGGAKLLFISPVIPNVDGHGAARRAELHVDLLCRRFRVSLLIVARDPAASADQISDKLRGACEQVEFVSAADRHAWPVRLTAGLPSKQLRFLGRAVHPRPDEIACWAGETLAAAAAPFRGRSFDVVHVFKLGMMPVGMAAIAGLHGPPGLRVIDFDDYESKVAFDNARFYRTIRGRQWAWLQTLEGGKLQRWERRAIRAFDTVLVCSDKDRDDLRTAHGTDKVHTVPNGLRVRDLPARGGGGEVPRLLFIGLLSYPPNEDAAAYFCERILPAIRERLGRPFRLRIVGRSPTPRVMALNDIPEVEVVGPVPAVEPYYAEADLAVVPLRSGGGTRIKILEAFSLGCPVVSTHKGAEGLGAPHGEVILLADRPGEFAEAVCTLLNDAASAKAMAEAARAFVSNAFSEDAIERSLADAYCGGQMGDEDRKDAGNGELADAQDFGSLRG
jgi:glycosyltransferase involved in cell wall biosynthesis